MLHLNPLLEKLAKEQKTVFFLGDFNVDLLKHEQHKVTNEFLDSLCSKLFLPYIIQPSRINSHSKYIIDNIFSNFISQEIISGNLTSTISDHLPEFLIASHIFSNTPNRKFNIFELNWSKLNCEEFILDYFAIDWPHILNLNNSNNNITIIITIIYTFFQNFFDSMSKIIDNHSQLKKLS